MSSDDRVHRLNQLLDRVRATASERGIELPRDLPEGSFAELRRRRQDSDPELAPASFEPAEDDVVMIESTRSERVLTAFPDGDVRADQPLALVPPPSRVDQPLTRLEPPPRVLPVSLPDQPLAPPALVQFTGHFDEEETSTGDAREIEALVLAEEELARRAIEDEIEASGLLDDGSAAPAEEEELGTIDIDDEVELVASDAPEDSVEIDDDAAGTDPPGPGPDPHAPLWADRPPSDDFSRAVVAFASSPPRAHAPPLELEDLEDLPRGGTEPPDAPTNEPPAQPALAPHSSASVLFDVARLHALENEHAHEVAAADADGSPQSSPRPVAFEQERDVELEMDSVPPASGEPESQPYPKSVRQTSEPDPEELRASMHIDDGLSERPEPLVDAYDTGSPTSEPPPATVHAFPAVDDEPTPRPVQQPTTEMRSLGSVDVIDRARVGVVEPVAVFEPRRPSPPATFGSVLDAALGLRKRQ